MVSLWESPAPAGTEVSGNNRTLPGALSVVVYRGLRSLWSLTHGYKNHTLRAVFRGVFPTIKILPPLTRFCMVILPTVGFVRTLGALFTHV